MTRVLFVCTGNTCRSPMAESLLKYMEISGVEVHSAGIYAENGMSASANAQKVLDEKGIPHDHQASALTEELVEWSTYILTMTAAHKATVKRRFEKAEPKTFTLNEFAKLEGNHDIGDPFGGSVEIYRETFLELEKAVEKIAEILAQESTEESK